MGKLGRYKTKAATLKAILKVKYERGGTYVGKALWEVVRDMKFRANPAVHKIVIVFTDGESFDHVVKRLSIRENDHDLMNGRIRSELHITHDFPQSFPHISAPTLVLDFEDRFQCGRFCLVSS